jgi:hypothetical protein
LRSAVPQPVPVGWGTPDVRCVRTAASIPCNVRTAGSGCRHGWRAGAVPRWMAGTRLAGTKAANARIAVSTPCNSLPPGYDKVMRMACSGRRRGWQTGAATCGWCSPGRDDRDESEIRGINPMQQSATGLRQGGEGDVLRAPARLADRRRDLWPVLAWPGRRRRMRQSRHQCHAT